MLAMADTKARKGHETELDDGLRAGRAQPMRRCALTRTPMPTAQMIRFVRGPDGVVVADVKKKLPGRGLWLAATRDTLSNALKKGVFSRGFGCPVQADAALIEHTEALLLTACTDALAMAGKAGAVVSGFAKVEKALAGGRVLALVHAAEGGADGVRKLASAARAADYPLGAPVPITLLTSAQLDLALARSNVIHAAVLDAPAGEAFVARCRRLADFRSGTVSGSPAPVTGQDRNARAGQAAAETEQDQ